MEIHKKVFRACHHNNLELLEKLLLDNNIRHWNILRQASTGDTCIHIAAKAGNVNVIEYLLKFSNPHESIDIGNNDSKTPLHEAAQSSQFMAVRYLIKNGANVNALKRSDWTPIMLACTKTGNNAFKTVQTLLESNASTSLFNKDGWTAVHLAVRSGDYEIVKMLIKYDLNSVFFKSRTNRTILHTACFHDRIHIVKLILGSYSFNLEDRDDCGNTCFLDSVLSGSIQLVKYLVFDVGVDRYVVNNVGFNALHIASMSGDMKMVEYLVTVLSFDPNQLSSGVNTVTPLHCAAKGNHEKVNNLLVRLGANENIIDNFGRTADDYLDDRGVTSLI